MERVRETLEARQVWIYFAAMAVGAVLGVLIPSLDSLEGAINPALALMLFATFMQVPLAEIGAALRNTKFIGALVITNFVVLPVVTAGLLQFLPDNPMLKLAVLFVLVAPCIDYVITFTHLGGGNARLLLAMTPVLLVLQMLLLPVYLGLMLGDEAAQLIKAGPFIHAFVWLIAVPLLAAGLIQALGKRTKGGASLVAALNLLPVPATALVLFIVLASVMPQIGLAQDAALRAAPIYLAFALIAPMMGWIVARAMRLESTSARAVSFSASYRNSLVILPLAFAVPGGAPLIPAVILTQTITELFFLPLYVRLIPRLSQGAGTSLLRPTDMELRHLRYFLAVAEELHFARAAERLHIEQSPLSRAIKELEEELGVVLFARTTRSTRLTRAGKLFLEHVRRVFSVLQQARDSVKAAANGFHGQLRVALSDGITPSRLPALLALCRQEEPEVEIRFFEVPLSQQIKGLHDDLYDVGFAQSDEVGDGIVALPVWNDTLMVAVPARHPLLAHKRIPLDELLRYPLVLCDPQVCESHAKHVDRVLRRADMEPLVAERVASCDLMMALVSAGFALGLAGAAHIAASREPGVVARPLALRVPALTTYLLRLGGEPTEVLARFIDRVEAIESLESPRPMPGRNLDPPEEATP